jgi:hypothetical protein
VSLWLRLLCRGFCIENWGSGLTAFGENGVLGCGVPMVESAGLIGDVMCGDGVVLVSVLSAVSCLWVIFRYASCMIELGSYLSSRMDVGLMGMVATINHGRRRWDICTCTFGALGWKFGEEGCDPKTLSRFSREFPGGNSKRVNVGVSSVFSREI